jgi:hypothetical protein
MPNIGGLTIVESRGIGAAILMVHRRGPRECSDTERHHHE